MGGTDRTGLRSRHSTHTQRGPTRTCVGCRGTDSWSGLLRVVAVEGEHGFVLTPDPRHRLPGRGAWLHPSRSCLDLALRRRAFPRALRVTAAVDSAVLVEYLGAMTEVESETETESGFDADEHPMSTQR
ncbi:YlxR family protein [Kribbia dieselivorans]|uniref:YlxR family protein n=1 Tax=Kribbia dieselivorans TaxID=331526 RepID=UPI0009FB8582|nr:YlxR family protein [Kribbia dieselivorans]